jgi:hypothetical protein
MRAEKLMKKNRQFLAKPAGTRYCFSESPASHAGSFPIGDVRPKFGVQNGEWLGNGAASH